MLFQLGANAGLHITVDVIVQERQQFFAFHCLYLTTRKAGVHHCFRRQTTRASASEPVRGHLPVRRLHQLVSGGAQLNSNSFRPQASDHGSNATTARGFSATTSLISLA